jgi:hypothetical protein
VYSTTSLVLGVVTNVSSSPSQHTGRSSSIPVRIVVLVLVSTRQNIGITGIQNRQNGAIEEFPTSRPQGRVITGVVMHLGTIRCNQNHLGLLTTQGFEGFFVPQLDFATLHDELETTVHGVLLLFLCVCVCVCVCVLIEGGPSEIYEYGV